MVEYADQMVDSGPAGRIDRLRILQNKAVCIIDNREHPELDTQRLSDYYRIILLKERRAENLGLIMYRLSKESKHLEKSRPEVHLRSSLKHTKEYMNGI